MLSLIGPPTLLALLATCMQGSPPPRPGSTLISLVRGAIQSIRVVLSALEAALSEAEEADVEEGFEPSFTPASSSRAGWDLISEGHGGGDQAAYDSFAASIPPLPAHCVDLCNTIGHSSAALRRQRAERAWIAGHWARAADQGIVPKPRPTFSIPGLPKNTVYVVIRAPGLEHPVVVHSAREYFKLIPQFRDSSSISHAFPSLSEARVYCLAFGIAFPGSQ